MINQPWKFFGFVWASFCTFLFLLAMLLLGWCWVKRVEPEDWSLHAVLHPKSPLRWWFKVWNIGAMTVGSLILYGQVDWAENAQLQKHERVHVLQCMRYGPFDLVLYLMAMLVAWAYGQDAYRGCDAEEQARYVSGETPMPDDIKPKPGLVK